MEDGNLGVDLSTDRADEIGDLYRSFASMRDEASLQSEEVYEFVQFYLEQAETELVEEIGYVPSSTDQRDANLEKLEEVAG